VRNDLHRMLVRIGTKRNIVIPTIWRTKPGPLLRAQQHNGRAINTVIRSLAWRRPNTAVIDWARVVQLNRSYQYDGIHLTRAGADRRYDMMCDALDRLRRKNP
jgi:hypothetical protein